MSGSLVPCEHLPKSIPSAVSSGALCSDTCHSQKSHPNEFARSQSRSEKFLSLINRMRFIAGRLILLQERAMWEWLQIGSGRANFHGA